MLNFVKKKWLIEIYSMSRKYNSLPKSHSSYKSKVINIKWQYIKSQSDMILRYVEMILRQEIVIFIDFQEMIQNPILDI